MKRYFPKHRLILHCPFFPEYVKIFVLACCFELLFPGRNLSQSCLPGGIIFTKQAQVDSFPVLYSDCFSIEGDVRIEGDDIVNLDGLHHVQFIEGSFVIINNPSLLSLQGLTSLESVQGDFLINNNDNLVDLSGIDQFHIAKGDLLISENDHLVRPGKLTVDTILGTLFLDENASMNDLLGLELLSYIGGDLLIMNNTHLTNLFGIDSLLYIGDHLELVNNPVLENIDALDQVQNTPWGLLRIENCNQLDNCAAKSICNHLAANGDAILANNAPGCNTEDEVETACTVDVKNPFDESGIIIFPNPTYNQIEINTSNALPLSFSFIDPYGKLLKTWPGEFHSLDISGFPTGIYFLQVQLRSQQVNRRIIKL
jgi:hypothetical protein